MRASEARKIKIDYFTIDDIFNNIKNRASMGNRQIILNSNQIKNTILKKLKSLGYSIDNIDYGNKLCVIIKW